MIARRYSDLECWQLANELKLAVYAFTAIEPAVRDHKYCIQVRDAARSAPRNIAEGFGRFWPKEFAQFLDYARASLMETHNHLSDARDLKYLSNVHTKELTLLANRAIGATTKLANYLRRKNLER